MRIISGDFKGRTFSPPDRDGVRPTTDMAKEGLFNILTHRYELDEIVVFDLFSGTGSIGFEFVSRGATQVFCIEKDPIMAAFIKSIAAKLQMSNLTVLRSDAFKFLALTTLSADIIFADPPYQSQGVSDLPELVFSKNLLKPNGLLIVEHDQNQHFYTNPHFKEVRNYGKVHFSFFQ
jgi:16S rRNA (guanine(966)-N(2))-methyltransferase RsmD